MGVTAATVANDALGYAAGRSASSPDRLPTRSAFGASGLAREDEGAGVGGDNSAISFNAK